MTQQTENRPSESRRRWSYEDYEASGMHRRGHGKIGAVLLILVAVILIAAVAFGLYHLLSGLSDLEWPDFSVFSSAESAEEPKQEEAETESAAAEPGEPLIIVERPEDEESEELTTVEIVEKVRPSVVGISIYTASSTLTPSATASGIIMSEDGYIITNSHVVADAVGIAVELENGESYTARKIGADDKTDLALLHIDAAGLTPAQFGNSEEVRVGERVVAIGNPAGSYLAGSTTQGIISGVNRTVGSGSYKTTFLQTDAAINPGNSGGALINVYGQVIGINSAKIADVDYEGIGFAIPIHEAKPIIDSLMQYGYVKDRTKIGFSGREIDTALAELNGYPTGIYVWSIEGTSSLAATDVKKGDIVTHIDGERVETFAEIGEILERHLPGDTIVLTVWRPADGKGSAETSFEVPVTLQEDRGD